jgi:glycosyltransferase involved in cell wall biosynthesis
MEGGPLIAIFCNSFPPEGGGASGRIYNLAILLRNAGYKVQVVSAMPNYPTGKIFSAYRGKLVVDEVVDGIDVRRVWIYPSNVASASIRGLSMMSFVASLRLFGFAYVKRLKPALVLVSSPPLLMAAAGVRYFSKRGIKVLLNVSDIWPLSASALGALNESTLYKRLEMRARVMYESAAALTAQSNATISHIKSQVGSLPPTMLYRNLPAQMSRQAPQARITPGTLKIIYPGLLGHAQGLLALCKAIDFSALGAELHIYGEGAELDALLTYTLAKPKRGVFLHQPVTASDLGALLGTYNALLVPLIAPIEGALPSKLFTAALAGIPVLYSGGGEGEELVSTLNLGYTASPADYPSICSQVRELASMSIADQLRWRQEIIQVADSVFDKVQQDRDFLEFVATLIGNVKKNKADQPASLTLL